MIQIICHDASYNAQFAKLILEQKYKTKYRVNHIFHDPMSLVSTKIF